MRKKHRINICVKGGNSKDRRRGEISSNFPIPGSIEQTLLDDMRISAARSSMVHNMQDAAALPTDKSNNQTANHEKSLRNKVQYQD